MELRTTQDSRAEQRCRWDATLLLFKNILSSNHPAGIGQSTNSNGTRDKKGKKDRTDGVVRKQRILQTINNGDCEK
jgi:hypothetical protein